MLKEYVLLSNRPSILLQEHIQSSGNDGSHKLSKEVRKDMSGMKCTDDGESKGNNWIKVTTRQATSYKVSCCYGKCKDKRGEDVKVTTDR